MAELEGRFQDELHDVRSQHAQALASLEHASRDIDALRTAHAAELHSMPVGGDVSLAIVSVLSMPVLCVCSWLCVCVCYLRFAFNVSFAFMLLRLAPCANGANGRIHQPGGRSHPQDRSAGGCQQCPARRGRAKWLRTAHLLTPPRCRHAPKTSWQRDVKVRAIVHMLSAYLRKLFCFL